MLITTVQEDSQRFVSLGGSDTTNGVGVALDDMVLHDGKQLCTLFGLPLGLYGGNILEN